jgi:hypothetical protein
VNTRCADKTLDMDALEKAKLDKLRPIGPLKLPKVDNFRTIPKNDTYWGNSYNYGQTKLALAMENEELTPNAKPPSMIHDSILRVVTAVAVLSLLLFVLVKARKAPL